MTSTLGVAITIATMAVAAFCAQGAAQDSLPVAKHESPFACSRPALTPEQRKRHFDELGPALRSLKTGVRELPDGFEFTFPSDMKTYQLLAEWVAGERACCPFFDIDLRSEREGGPVSLRLTGREGTKQFIEMDFAGWFKR
jgi:hypothetical protein